MRRRKRATRRYLVREFKLTPGQIDELTQRQIGELYLSGADDAPTPAGFARAQAPRDPLALVAAVLGRSRKSVQEGLKWNEGSN